MSVQINCASALLKRGGVVDTTIVVSTLGDEWGRTLNVTCPTFLQQQMNMICHETVGINRQNHFLLKNENDFGYLNIITVFLEDILPVYPPVNNDTTRFGCIVELASPCLHLLTKLYHAPVQNYMMLTFKVRPHSSESGGNQPAGVECSSQAVAPGKKRRPHALLYGHEGEGHRLCFRRYQGNGKKAAFPRPCQTI